MATAGASAPLLNSLEETDAQSPPSVDHGGEHEVVASGIECTEMEHGAGARREGETLEQALLRQVEFYFSKKNLQTDHYLVSRMNSQAYVPLNVIAGFRMVSSLTSDAELLKKVLRESKAVQMDESNPEAPLVRPAFAATAQRATVILRDVPKEVTEEEIKTLFAEHPDIISLKPDIGDTWFITFSSEQSARDAHDAVRQKKLHDKPVMARIKSENVLKQILPTMTQPVLVDPQAYPNQPGYYMMGAPPPPMGFPYHYGIMQYPYGRGPWEGPYDPNMAVAAAGIPGGQMPPGPNRFNQNRGGRGNFRGGRGGVAGAAGSFGGRGGNAGTAAGPAGGRSPGGRGNAGNMPSSHEGGGRGGGRNAHGAGAAGQAGGRGGHNAASGPAVARDGQSQSQGQLRERNPNTKPGKKGSDRRVDSSRPALGPQDFPPLPTTSSSDNNYDKEFIKYPKQKIIDLLSCNGTPDRPADLPDCVVLASGPQPELELTKPISEEEAPPGVVTSDPVAQPDSSNSFAAMAAKGSTAPSSSSALNSSTADSISNATVAATPCETTPTTTSSASSSVPVNVITKSSTTTPASSNTPSKPVAPSVGSCANASMPPTKPSSSTVTSEASSCSSAATTSNAVPVPTASPTPSPVTESDASTSSPADSAGQTAGTSQNSSLPKKSFAEAAITAREIQPPAKRKSTITQASAPTNLPAAPATTPPAGRGKSGRESRGQASTAAAAGGTAPSSATGQAEHAPNSRGEGTAAQAHGGSGRGEAGEGSGRGGGRRSARGERSNRGRGTGNREGGRGGGRDGTHREPREGGAPSGREGAPTSGRGGRAGGSRGRSDRPTSREANASRHATAAGGQTVASVAPPAPEVATTTSVEEVSKPTSTTWAAVCGASTQTSPSLAARSRGSTDKIVEDKKPVVVANSAPVSKSASSSPVDE